MKNRFRILKGSCLTVFLLTVGISFITKAQQSMNQSDHKIKITIKEQVLIATLNDSEAARDFKALLPITLTLEDYADKEKVSDLPKSLSTKGAPSGSKASAGDIAFYAPWGNLAIFYKDFRYSEGLIILGRMDGNIDILKKYDPLQAEIQLVK